MLKGLLFLALILKFITKYGNIRTLKLASLLANLATSQQASEVKNRIEKNIFFSAKCYTFFVVYYSIVLINSKYRYNTKNIKNMPAVGEDQKSCM